MLLRDGGLPQEMDVNSARGINLTMLVLSLLDCMSNNTAMGDLNPLSELINQPLQAVNHFLPTMVDDQYEAQAENIRRALQKEGENPVPYGKQQLKPLLFIFSCDIVLIFHTSISSAQKKVLSSLLILL